jgi:hypothetical protein
VRLRIAFVCVLLPLGLLLGVACVSVGTPSPSTSGAGGTSESGVDPSPTPTQVAAPESLRADQPHVWKADPKSWSVVLTWDPPPGFEADHYEVDRNDHTLEATLPGTRLVDQDVLPETPYHYDVTAVDAGGVRTDTASVTVDTNAPPVADARLEGRFAMKMHITSQSGLQSGASGGGMLFVYDPVCANGPCDVTWSRKGSSGSGRLDRDDASYDGTVHAPFLLQSCHGGVLTETLVFTTKVVEARVVQNAWRATKIQGTLHESATSSGCVLAGIDWNFAGFVQT